MTTLIYDGVRMAVDSRSTIHRPNCVGEQCRQCGSDVTTTHGIEIKLKVPEKAVRYNDQPVIALSWYGNQTLSDGLTVILKQGVDFEKAAKIIEPFVHVRQKHNAGGIFIMTEATCYDVFMDNGKIAVTEIVKFPYGKGSGSKAALAVMYYLNMDAVAAVAMSSRIDAGSGGTVYSIDREQREFTRTDFTAEQIDAFRK